MKTANEAPHTWRAEEYHYHSSIQTDAAFHLLNNISLRGDEKILDVGCGDGKISAAIAEKVNFGHVTGIDLSKEMILFAKEHFSYCSNLEFSVKKAEELDYFEEFEVIFSSYVLSWVKDKDAFLKRAYRALISDGIIAITMPMGISSPLELSIRFVTTQPKWNEYFRQFSPGWHCVTSDEFLNLLHMNHFKLIRFEEITKQIVFNSRKEFEQYVIQWFSYLQPLPECLKQVFFKQVIDKYLELEPALASGQIYFKFPQLDTIASKNLS